MSLEEFGKEIIEFGYMFDSNHGRLYPDILEEFIKKKLKEGLD